MCYLPQNIPKYTTLDLTQKKGLMLSSTLHQCVKVLVHLGPSLVRRDPPSYAGVRGRVPSVQGRVPGTLPCTPRTLPCTPAYEGGSRRTREGPRWTRTLSLTCTNIISYVPENLMEATPTKTRSSGRMWNTRRI